MIAAAALAGLLVGGLAGPASADHDVTPARIAGENRYETAVEIATEQYPDGTDWALVANAERFPDALAAAPAAAELGAPILLTQADDVPEVTLDALRELGVSEVRVLGGPAAVSDGVVATIAQSQRANVERLAGENRYETAAAIAAYVQARNDNSANFPGDQRAAFLASGDDFPDALAAGALAASRSAAPIPLLLTAPATTPQVTLELIENLQIELVIIAGGPAAVSPAVEAQIEDDDTNVVRVHGQDRTETATELADFGIEYLDLSPARIELARGDAFPDALTAAPFAGAFGHPILLTGDPNTLTAPTHAWLQAQCSDIEAIRALGGPDAVSVSTLEEAETAAEDCHDTATETQQSYIVAPQQYVEADVGQESSFSLSGRYDQQAVTERVDVVLFPCDSVVEPTDGDFRFRDANADGRADGIESTETGAAVITHVQGEEIVAAKGIRNVQADQDGRIEVTVRADAADCAAVVFFHDADNSSALEVDAEGYPTEDWGWGRISWS